MPSRTDAAQQPSSESTPIPEETPAIAQLETATPASETPAVVPSTTPTNDSVVSNQLPPENIAPPAAPASQVQYKDGTFLAWGSCRHGDIRVAVVIQGGRIASAEIAECETRYPCTWIEKAPGQVVSRQSPNVDYVSGATESIDAFQEAVIFALNKAK